MLVIKFKMSSKRQSQLVVAQQDDVLAMWSCAGNYSTKVVGSGNMLEKNMEKEMQKKKETMRANDKNHNVTGSMKQCNF